MIDPHFYRYWSFWKRVLLFAAGVAGLAGTTLAVTPQLSCGVTAQQAQWLAFAVAVLNLAISLLPDAAVEAVTPLRGSR